MNQSVSRGGGGFGNRQSGGGSRSAFSSGREDADTSTIEVSAIRFGAGIDSKLYSDIAEAAARAVGEAGKSRDVNKSTQLRRFYDELVMLQERVGPDAKRFEAQAPFIQMLKAKVAYAKGRRKVDANFDKLLRKIVDEVKDASTLRQAKLFMEAFMAFYKVHGPKERD
jgi:CRISPR-associated protein Csm2